MDAYAKAFWLPKNGSSEEEYDDAYFPRTSKAYPIVKRRRFAVADGATESSFSKLWADLLVTSFVRGGLAVQIDAENLTSLQERWSSKLRGKVLPWYAEEKLASGAFAAFLGLELDTSGTEAETQRAWRAAAAGDSCLVQLRGNQIIKSFPLADAESFPARPVLLASIAAMNTAENTLVQTEQGTWGCDDTFFLMTDALSRWFLDEFQKGNEPWNVLRDLDTCGQGSFPELVHSLRSQRAIKDDDVTLLRIDILG